MREKMTEGKHEHLLPEVVPLLSLPLEKRIRIIKKDGFVSYDLAERALAYMEDLFESPINERPDNLMITGMAGSGKTAILSHWEKQRAELKKTGPAESLLQSMPGGGKTSVVLEMERRHPGYSTVPVEMRPVVRVTVPPGGRVDLITEILTTFGWDTTGGARSSNILQARVCKTLMDCKTRILILDDINNLRESRSGKVTHSTWETLKFIRYMSDKLHIHIVYTGDETSSRIVNEDASLRTRMNIIELPPWKNDALTAKLLRDLEATLPLKEPSFLGHRKRTSLIFSLGQQTDRDGRTGRLYYLVKLPKKAAQFALKDRRESIKDEDLEKAANWYGRGSRLPN